MRAWQLRRHGEPGEVLELVERPDPNPSPDQVLVDVRACAVNFADVLLCRGTYQERPDLPFTPGIEFAGVVRSAPPGSALTVGQRVVAIAALPYGGLAERGVAAALDCLPLPDDVDDVTAVALHVTYQTAWFGLVRRARLQPDEWLLVTAAAGGAGSAALQLGVALGARVIACASGPDKLDRCRSEGALAVVDARSDDVVHQVLDITDGHGADVVYDPVGGDLFDLCRRAVAFEGRLVVVGFASGRIPDAPMNHLLVKNYDLIGLHWGAYRTRWPELRRAAHEALLELLRDGRLTPRVSRHRLDEAALTLVELAAGATTGRLVIVP